MIISKLSIKNLTVAAFIVIGVVTVVLAIVASYNFKQSAIASQEKTMSRILEVAAKEELRQLRETTLELATDLKKIRAFRSAAGTYIRKPSDELKQKLITVMNDQFHQRYVTIGLLDLKKIRIYDTKFNFLLETTEGEKSLSPSLTEIVLTKADGREGADRLKAVDGLWLDDSGKPAYSVLVPIGGLRLAGYMEVVVSPQHNLFKINNTLEAPFTVTGVDGAILKQTKSWSDDSSESLTIHYTLNNANNEKILSLSARENVSFLFEQIRNTQIITISGFVVAIAVAVGLLLLVLGRFLFRPLKTMLKGMHDIAEGDLTVKSNVAGLKDINTIAMSMNSLVDALREQVQTISSDSVRLKQAAEHVSVTTSETNDGVMQQHNEIDQLATAINEMQASAQEVARNASAAAESAHSADEHAHSGQSIVTRSIDSINVLAGDISSAGEVIDNLRSQSESIGTVTDVIKGIAEQTNLLALNAAIEAARAGEQGRGFAVVADEVRSLASRTQESTQEIQQMIDKLQQEAGDAVVVMQKNLQEAQTNVELAQETGSALQAINSSVNAINDMNTQIAAAADEQRLVAEEINQNITGINTVAQQTSSGAQQTQDDVEQLYALADELQAAVQRFKLE